MDSIYTQLHLHTFSTYRSFPLPRSFAAAAAMSLFSLMLQRLAFCHVQTGVASLDSALPLDANSGILDLQAVPATNIHHALLCGAILSHLAEGENHTVALVAAAPFPFRLLQKHPLFNASFRPRIIAYRVASVAQAYTVFSGRLTAKPATLVVFCGFHELAELHRLQLAAAHHETLLKFHVSVNADLVARQDQLEHDGIPQMAQIPPNSQLLTKNPAIRSESHIQALVKRISNYSYTNGLLVVLSGTLDLLFRPYTRVPASLQMLATPSSSGGSFTLFADPGRMVLGPTNLAYDAYINARVIIYRDWYHRTPHYQRLGAPRVTRDLLRLVFVASVANFSLLTNITAPVYFDFADEWYGKKDGWFYDLLERPRLPVMLASLPPLVDGQEDFDESQEKSQNGTENVGEFRDTAFTEDEEGPGANEHEILVVEDLDDDVGALL